MLEFYKKNPEALDEFHGPIYEEKVVDLIDQLITRLGNAFLKAFEDGWLRWRAEQSLNHRDYSRGAAVNGQWRQATMTVLGHVSSPGRGPTAQTGGNMSIIASPRNSL